MIFRFANPEKLNNIWEYINQNVFFLLCYHSFNKRVCSIILSYKFWVRLFMAHWHYVQGYACLKRDSLRQLKTCHRILLIHIKKVNRKGQGIPQSQTAANPRQQEEEKKDKNIHAQNKQTNVREAPRPAPSSTSEVIRMLLQTEKRGQRAWEDFKTLSAPWYKPQSYTELRTTPGPPP